MNRILLVLLLFVWGVGGCGPADERVRIRIWHQKISAERAFLEEVVARYNQVHDDHVVEVLYRENEELRNLFIIGSVGGQGPELIYGPADNVSVYALTEAIMPIDRVLGLDYLSQFNEDGIVSWEGNPWMVADQIGNHLAFVYNTDLIPEPPETTDEMIALFQTLTKDTDGNGRPDQYGLTWNYREPFFFIPFLTGFGGWVMDEQGNPTLDTEATVKAIRFILDLRDRYQVIPGESDLDVANTLFIEGRAASIINGPWSWAGYGEAGVNYALARIPKISETGLWCAPMISAKGYSVNANLDEAKMTYVQEVLQYLTNAEMQAAMAQRLATIPVIDAVRNAPFIQEDPVLRASLRQLEVGHPMPAAPQLRQIWDGMRGPYQLIMNGAVTPEEGARMMQEEVEKRIKDTFL